MSNHASHTERRRHATALVAATVFAGLSGCAHLVWGPLPGEGDDVGRTVIYRDTWGVAHIYAPTVEAGLYAVGFAQAEDRPHELLRNLLRGVGEYAAVAGEAAVPSDLRALRWDHYGVAKRGWTRLPPELQRHVAAYVDGINDFYADHPQDRPDWWGTRRVDPAAVLAFGRSFFFGWSIDEAYGDLARGGVELGYESFARASNQFAVAPTRSAENAAILAIDPHMPWDGHTRVWEFRIHAGELHGSGVTLPGLPHIAVGHNRHIAWAFTSGGPDTADVYELTLDPDDQHRYRYDGQWRPLTERAVTIAVNGAAPRVETLRFSHHGPIVAVRGNRAYAARIAYADLLAVEPLYDLNFATGYRDAVAALETRMVFPQNVMVADTSGNIYYQRAGRVPRRPPGFDWSRPVDGSTAATEWRGVHPAADHLQVLNPYQGYMQNCNVPPDAMMIDSPFALDPARPYLFAAAGQGPRRFGWINARGARAIELLTSNTAVTARDAIAYITDLRPYGIERWLGVFRRADAAHGADPSLGEAYAGGMQDLLAWDGALAADSTAALKYVAFREQLARDRGRDAAEVLASSIEAPLAVLAGSPAAEPDLADAELRSLAHTFAAAMERLRAEQGSLDAVYGARFRVGRGDHSWPVGGGNAQDGTATLRKVGYVERPDGTRWGVDGQTSTQVVVLSEPPQSWIAVPWGQSDREDSRHFADQAERVFSPRRLKPSWWLPDDLARHVESRRVLERAPPGDS